LKDLKRSESNLGYDAPGRNFCNTICQELPSNRTPRVAHQLSESGRCDARNGYVRANSNWRFAASALSNHNRMFISRYILVAVTKAFCASGTFPMRS
jgi:hypothetical protein